MPFKGDNPLGTAGGLDLYNAPQFPRIYAVADGPMYILVMRLNGDLYERNRENVEDVIRVIGLRGENLAGFIVRHTGGVVESSATDLDFDAGFSVGQIAPGVVVINIGNNAIVTGMLAADLITNGQLADNAVQRENILDGEIITSKFAAGAVDTAALGALAVTLAKMAPNSVDASKLVAGAVTTAALNAGAVDTAALGALAVTLAKLAPNSVDSSKIVDGSITAIDIAPGTFPEAGLTLLFEDTFNASTARSFNNVFTAAYDNYLIEGQVTHGSAAQSTFLRLRSGGVDSASVNQYVGAWTIGANPAGAPTIAAAGAQGTAGEIIRAVAGGTPNNYGFWLNLYGPALVKPTPILFMTGGLHSGASFTSATGFLWQGQAQSFDGFSIFSAAAMTGYIRIYGKKNTP